MPINDGPTGTSSAAAIGSPRLPPPGAGQTAATGIIGRPATRGHRPRGHRPPQTTRGSPARRKWPPKPGGPSGIWATLLGYPDREIDRRAARQTVGPLPSAPADTHSLSPPVGRRSRRRGRPVRGPDVEHPHRYGTKVGSRGDYFGPADPQPGRPDREKSGICAGREPAHHKRKDLEVARRRRPAASEPAEAAR